MATATGIALLRGINVGGRNPLPMKSLREILAGLGLRGVRTYVQSGNAVFEAPADGCGGLAPRIGEAIGAVHGFVPQVLVLTVEELQRAVVGNPFPAAGSEPKSLHLSFLESAPAAPDLEKLENLRRDSESFRLIDQVFYLHAPDGIGRSKLAAAAEKALGVTATGRNWRSVQAILALATEE